MRPVMSDEDDEVEPQLDDVNKYEFEDGEKEPVCFSVLPLLFDKDGVADCGSGKNVYLRGYADRLHVYKEVMAWRVELDHEEPYIFVLSRERKWIRLLKPQKYYEKIVRSILITVQTLHFATKADHRTRSRHLWEHLYEVFGKYDTKPAVDDLVKHDPLIKMFEKMDPRLRKSKILQSLIDDDSKKVKKAKGTKMQASIGGRRRKSDDTKDSGKGANDDDITSEDDDYITSEGDNDDDSEDYNGEDSEDDNGDDSKDENGNNSEDDSGDNSKDDSGDDSEDDDISDDDTDHICAICDDGGYLLSCDGPCKRSFHPTKRTARDSDCETLRLAVRQVKRIDIYLCKNCKYKQHQCFKCGELESSDGPNAKVFQCNNASCGHFYHPKCIAQLLEADSSEGACALEERIMAGMSFTCPVHWCFKCQRMEDKTQTALKFAQCRRCPRAYHRGCLPRELSLKRNNKNVNKYIWKISGKVYIYCLDQIDEASGSGSGNHIKFPDIPEGSEARDPGKSKGRMTGKRKRNTDQYLTNSIKLSNESGGVEKQTQTGAVNNSSTQVLEPQCEAKHSKGGDLQFEPSMVDAATSLNVVETVQGSEKQFDISSLHVTGDEVRSNDSNKSHSWNGATRPVHVEDQSPEKPLCVAYVDRMAVLIEDEPKYSQCNDSLPAIPDASVEESGKTSEPKGKAPNANEVHFDKNSQCNGIEDGGEAHCEGGNFVHPEAYSTHQSSANRKERGAHDCNFEHGRLNISQCNDENTAVETFKYESRDSIASSRKEEPMHNTGESSCEPPLGGNTRAVSRSRSLEGQRMDHRTKSRQRYNQGYHPNYSRNDSVDRRQRSLGYSPSSHDDFVTVQRHSSHSYMRTPEHPTRSHIPPGYRTNRRLASPSDSRPRYGPSASRGYCSSSYPRTQESARYTMDWNNAPDLDYFEYRCNGRYASPPPDMRVPEPGTGRGHGYPYRPRSEERCYTTGRSHSPIPHIDDHEDVMYRELGRYEYNPMDIDDHDDVMYRELGPRSEERCYTTGRNHSPIPHINGHDDIMYRELGCYEYNPMDIDPVNRYSPRQQLGRRYSLSHRHVNMEGCATMYGHEARHPMRYAPGRDRENFRQRDPYHGSRPGW